MANACGTNLCLSVAGGNRGFSRACSSTQFRRPEECAHWNHAKSFFGGIIYCIAKHFLRAKNALTQSGMFFPCGIPQLWTLRCCLAAGATPTPPPPPLPSGPLRGLAYAPPLGPQRQWFNQLQQARALGLQVPVVKRNRGITEEMLREFVKTPRLFVQSSMIPHEPFLAFTGKKDKRKKTITLNIGSVNDLCPDS